MSYSKSLFPSSNIIFSTYTKNTINTINTTNTDYIINPPIYNTYIVDTNTNIILPNININNGQEINILNNYNDTIQIVSQTFKLFNSFFTPSDGTSIFVLASNTYIKLRYFNQRWYIISS
jgi:hypothetical protein